MMPCAVIAVLLLGAACGAVERAPAEDAGSVRGHGLAIELPPGWHGDVSRPDAGSAPLLRSATFPLTESPTDLGQGVHQLWVVSGDPSAGAEVLARANEALETLMVVPRRIGLDGFTVEVPDGWSGFAKDLDPGPEEAPTVVVANVPWRDDGQSLAHVATTEQFGRLPADGIVVGATAGRYPVGKPDQDPAEPVRLVDGHFIADEYEGQPAPHVSAQIISRRLGDRWVSAQVYFGRNDPTLGMRTQADAVLGSLELRESG